MDQYGIEASTLSFGNPWLDFLTSNEDRAVSGPIAAKVRSEMEGSCCIYEGRLYSFVVLPLITSLELILTEISTLP
jgi:aminocarboxymuconate-semialdehyde decarboxylase